MFLFENAMEKATGQSSIGVVSLASVNESYIQVQDLTMELAESFLVEDLSDYLAESKGEEKGDKGGFLKRVWAKIVEFFKKVKETFLKVYNYIKDLVAKLWNKLKSALGMANEKEVNSKLEAAKAKISAGAELAAKTVAEAGNGAKGLFGKIRAWWNGGESDGSAENQEIKNAIEKYKETIYSNLKELNDANSEGKQKILDVKTAQDALNAAKAAAAAVGKNSDIVKELEELAKQIAAEEAKHAKSSNGAKVISAITSLTSTLTGATRSAASNAASIAAKAAGRIFSMFGGKKDKAEA